MKPIPEVLVWEVFYITVLHFKKLVLIREIWFKHIISHVCSHSHYQNRQTITKQQTLLTAFIPGQFKWSSSTHHPLVNLLHLLWTKVPTLYKCRHLKSFHNLIPSDPTSSLPLGSIFCTQSSIFSTKSFSSSLKKTSQYRCNLSHCSTVIISWKLLSWCHTLNKWLTVQHIQTRWSLTVNYPPVHLSWKGIF